MKQLPFFAISVVLFAVDQLVKSSISSNRTNRSLIPGVLSLTYAENTGISFSMLDNAPVAMVFVNLVAGLVVLALVAVILTGRVTSALGNIALAVILGGAAGNMFDRLSKGFVVDMFRFDFVNFAIFNVADVCLTIGTAALIIWYIRGGSLISVKERL